MQSDGQLVERTSEEHLSVANLSLISTVRKIRSLGKKVVIVAPPPAMDFDAGRCIERKLRGLPSFGVYRECMPERSEVDIKRADVHNFLNGFGISNDVSIIRFDDALTVDGKIRTAVDGQNIFIANAHLSYFGSIYLSKKLNLVNDAVALAR